MDRWANGRADDWARGENSTWHGDVPRNAALRPGSRARLGRRVRRRTARRGARGRAVMCESAAGVAVC
jgi:hypothetical protein